MFSKATTQQRKLRQIKYLLRQLLPKKRQQLSLEEELSLTQRFKRLYGQRRQLPLSYKVKQAAFALALSLGMQQAQAQVTFAAPVNNPYNMVAAGLDLYSGDLVDIDGDGDLDLMYGSYGAVAGGAYGPLLNFQENIGTATLPNFSAPIINPYSIVLNTNGVAPAPQFADMDGDGDMDMMVTYYDYYGTVGGIEYFQNIGTATVPNFAAGLLNTFGITNPSYDFPNVNLHDIDGDGDIDLFTGEMYGYAAAGVKYQENTGTATAPAFGASQTNAFLPANPFPAGSVQTYFDFADLDGDGDLDLYVNYYDYYNTYQYQLSYFENTGTATVPAFAPLATNLHGIVPPANTRYRDLIFGDLDGDGDDDLLTFGNYGGFVYYENISLTGAAPILNFDSTSITINEGVGNLNVDVNITNTSPNPVTVEVNVSTASTADNGLDYLVAPNQILTFPANSSGVQTLVIPITDDAIVEPTEQFILTLANPTNFATFGSQDTLVVDIVDNDFGVPTIDFDTANYSISEAGGILSIPITITNPSPNATSVDVSIGAASTADANDVAFTSPATFTFGGNTSTPLVLSLPITDDLVFEGVEDLVLELSNVTNGGTIGTIDRTTIQILDNEAQPTVSFTQDSFVVNEGAGSVDVSFVLSGPIQDTASVEILLLAPSSSATNGADYTINFPNRIVFLPNETIKLLNVPIVDDALIENTERVSLVLALQTPNLLLGNADASVYIVDNDNPISTTSLDNVVGLQSYPNPFGAYLRVETPTALGKSLRLVNAMGQVLVEQEIAHSILHLQTDAWPAGPYWLQVYDPQTGQVLGQKYLLHQ